MTSASTYSTVLGACNGFGFCGLTVSVNDSTGGLSTTQTFTLYLHVKYSFAAYLSGLSFTTAPLGNNSFPSCPLAPYTYAGGVVGSCVAAAHFDSSYSVHVMEVEQTTEALFVNATFTGDTAVVQFCGYDDPTATLANGLPPSPYCAPVYTKLNSGVVATGVGSVVTTGIYLASTTSTNGFPDSTIAEQIPERLLPGQINTIVVSVRSEAYSQAAAAGNALLVTSATASYYVYAFRRLKFSNNKLGAITLHSPRSTLLTR